MKRRTAMVIECMHRRRIVSEFHLDFIDPANPRQLMQGLSPQPSPQHVAEQNQCQQGGLHTAQRSCTQRATTQDPYVAEIIWLSPHDHRHGVTLAGTTDSAGEEELSPQHYTEAIPPS